MDKSGAVIQVKDGNTLKQEIRLGEVSQFNLFGNVQLSTQAGQALCTSEVPVCYFSQGGWFYGITNGLKARNQRTLLQHNHIEPPETALRQLKALGEKAETASEPGVLLGIEGSAARVYFSEFAGMLKPAETASLMMRIEVRLQSSISALCSETGARRATR